MLKEAVTAQEIAEFDLTQLADMLRNGSRGRFGQPKAEALPHAARQSVGIGFLADAVCVEMRCLLQQIDLLQEQTSQIDELLAELMGHIPQHIASMPGTGLVTGAAILAEIGDAHRFDSSEKLVAYAGIDPSVYQTGQFQASEAHMSKRGSPCLRHALWLAATVAVRNDPQLVAFYQTKREQGEHHGTALGAVCRKLLARIYVILKEQRPHAIR